MLATALVVGFLAAATVTDVRTHRIYNWITYPGIVTGWAGHAAGTLLAAAGWADPQSLCRLGWVGLADSLAGFLACGAVMLVCFVLFQVGGGDVKLMAMMGAMLGTERGILAMLWTFVLGACTALVVLIWRLGPGRLFRLALRQVLWMVRLGGFSPLSAEEQAELKPPLYLAPCGLGAVMIVQFSLAERVMF